jgi:hypothetical protein
MAHGTAIERMFPACATSTAASVLQCAPSWLAPARLPESDTKRKSSMTSRTQVPELHELGGRYWDRTSDLLGVNEALSR